MVIFKEDNLQGRNTFQCEYSAPKVPQLCKLDMHREEISNKLHTIEKYFSMQRIEKTKELIKYDELNLSEIAYKLNYSSVAHLSKQFKQVTGMSPSDFKKQQNSQRKGIDQI